MNDTTKTNILVIQADQLNPKYLGAYGHPLAKTPHIDALAENGVVFDSAYTNFPLCAPSRFSMMSGQLSSTVGAYDNGAEFTSSTPTFAHYLRHLDYQTCLVGKMHFVGADQLHGFEERLTTDIYPGDFGWTGDWTEVRPRHANNAITFTGSGICPRNVQIDYDDEVSHRAKRKIYDLARSSDDRPFLLFTSFTHPHDPFQCRQEHWDLYRHDDIPMPEYVPDQADLDPYSKRLIVQYGLKDAPPTEEQVRIARHAYLGSVSYFDDCVGELVATLKESGLYDNTMIILTTDHGEMLGEHGLWYKKSFFEDSCRIPFICSQPGLDRKRVSSNVSLVDLLPTLLAIGGDENANCLVDPVAGRNLLPLVEGSDTEIQGPVFSENLAEGATTPLLMVKDDHLKFIFSDVDPHQLFDLSVDPNESKNLIDDPDYQQQREELLQQVHQNWDVASLKEDILVSQRKRLFLSSVLKKGKSPEWDFTPADQAEDHCLRGKDVYNDWAYSNMMDFKHPAE